MILSDASRRQLLASGTLSIDPLDVDQIRPASVGRMGRDRIAEPKPSRGFPAAGR